MHLHEPCEEDIYGRLLRRERDEALAREKELAEAGARALRCGDCEEGEASIATIHQYGDYDEGDWHTCPAHESKDETGHPNCSCASWVCLWVAPANRSPFVQPSAPHPATAYAEHVAKGFEARVPVISCFLGLAHHQAAPVACKQHQPITSTGTQSSPSQAGQ
jgi:hypothetical protein